MSDSNNKNPWVRRIKTLTGGLLLAGVQSRAPEPDTPVLPPQHASATAYTNTFSTSDLEKFSALKCKGNELYDLAVPGMQQMYDELVRTEPAKVISRDTSSFEEIRDSVIEAAKKHSGDGIVILSGAYVHMIGALVNLQKEFNIEYVPIDGMQISTETPDGKNKVTKNDLQVQIKRNIGVTKYLGYKTMEAFRKAIESKPHYPNKRTLVVIVEPETGLHHLDTYFQSSDKALAALEEIIPTMRDRLGFVSYIREDLQVENLENSITDSKIDTYPRNAFLERLHNLGIPIEIGAFGHRDRNNTQFEWGEIPVRPYVGPSKNR